MNFEVLLEYGGDKFINIFDMFNGSGVSVSELFFSLFIDIDFDNKVTKFHFIKVLEQVFIIFLGFGVSDFDIFNSFLNFCLDKLEFIEYGLFLFILDIVLFFKFGYSLGHKVFGLPALTVIDFVKCLSLFS